MGCSLPGSSVHGIFQARILEWGLPFPSPGDLPDPGIESGSPSLQADALTSEPPGMPLYFYIQFVLFREQILAFKMISPYITFTVEVDFYNTHQDTKEKA